VCTTRHILSRENIEDISNVPCKNQAKCPRANIREALKLTGENLGVALAEFSTLSWAVFVVGVIEWDM
jgi:hypothetical protein